MPLLIILNMTTFSEYLGERVEASDGLKSILFDVGIIAGRMHDVFGREQKGYAGSENVHGEKQLKLDLIANDTFVDVLKRNSHVAMLASEEMEEAIETGTKEEEVYSVAFDPLDGSSLVDVNLAVGSIVSIYKGKGFVGRKAGELVAAMMIVYGPRTTFMVSTGKGVDEFTFVFGKTYDFILSGEALKIAGEYKMFAPGNLRVCVSEPWYLDLMGYWAKNGYTLRYSGGMVPDINQILRKGGGVFTYPGYKEKPNGKLRLLYECAPISFLIEQAGGKSSYGRGAVLDLVINELHQRTPIFTGSTKEVDLALSYLPK
jgi:fructose-1,6-bisphosphatase I